MNKTVQLFLISSVPIFLGLLPFKDKAFKLRDCLHGYFSVPDGGKEVLLNIAREEVGFSTLKLNIISRHFIYSKLMCKYPWAIKIKLNRISMILKKKAILTSPKIVIF